jgi:hypothetical protein
MICKFDGVKLLWLCAVLERNGILGGNLPPYGEGGGMDPSGMGKDLTEVHGEDVADSLGGRLPLNELETFG